MTGLKVLDLTQILAGPSSGRILAEMGADVVKVNAPQRRIAAHGMVNRGKHTILLDVQSPAGQEVFWRLVDESDVIVQNFPPGTAERYGIGYATVKARKPGIVHVSVSCYGGVGPWAAGRGYETQGQAVTGLMARAGGPGGRPAVLGPYNLLDYGTGVMAAYAATLGVYHRTVTGEGARLRTSLAQTGTYHQARYLVGKTGGAGTEPAGPGALGEGPLQRFYQASDGWFFLGATPRDLDRLRTVDGLGDLGDLGEDRGAARAGASGVDGGADANGRDRGDGRAGGDDGHDGGAALAVRLEKVFAARPAAEWVDALQAAGVGAHQVVGLADLMAASPARDRKLSVSQVSEEVGEVTMPGVPIGMSATPPRIGDAVRRPGADAVAVLDRVGLGGDIGELTRRWAVQTEGLPEGWER